MEPASTTPTALLLIDIQQGFKHPSYWGPARSTPDFESNVSSILQGARTYNQTHHGRSRPILIIHVHHHSSSPASALHPSAFVPGSDALAVSAMDYASPLSDEPVLTKNVNSGFVGTDLEARLKDFGARQLIVAGLTTDHCVSTTVRMAANLQVLGDRGGPDGTGEGHHGIFLLRDATATFNAKGGFDVEAVHAVHLGSLDGEFAAVKTTSEVLRAVMETGV